MKQRKHFYNNPKTITILLILSDALSVVIAFFLSYYLRDKGFFRAFLDSVQPIYAYLTALPVAITFLLSLFALLGLYTPLLRITKIAELYTVFKGATLWMLFIMTGSYLTKFDYSRIIVILLFFFTTFLVAIGRLFLRTLQKQFPSTIFGRINILIIGFGRPGQKIAQRLASYQAIGFRVVGFVDDKALKRSSVLGGLSQLNRLIKKHDVQEIYVADPTLSHERILTLVSKSVDMGVKFKIASNIFDLITGTVDIAKLESIPFLDVNRITVPLWKRVYKRIFDIALASLALLLCLPLFLIIMIAILLDSPSPALFLQTRIGEGGKPFRMYKFRTMRKDTPIYDDPPRGSDDPRITRVGKWLRRTSLDELPQLINIIKGEMSIVGPRPEMPYIVKKYSLWEKRRLAVKPGLTGLWQILGRKDLPLAHNLEYDFYYINNQSLMLDIVIILKTIPLVLRGKGAY